MCHDKHFTALHLDKPSKGNLETNACFSENNETILDSEANQTINAHHTFDEKS